MINIKDFYLNTPMKKNKYMQLKISEIPGEITKEYKLDEIMTADGYIYIAKYKKRCMAYFKLG